DFAAYNKDLLKSENLDDKGTGFGLQQRSKASLACNGAMNLLLRASTARHEGRVDPLYVELAQIPGMDLYLRNFLASAMNYHLQSYRVYSESGNATFLPDCRTAQNFMRYILNESLIGAYASETFAKINSGDICESLGIPNLVHTELDVARVLLNATLYFDDTVIPMIAKSLRILSSVDSGARYQRGSEILELIKKGGPSGHPLVAAVNNTSD
ncbi:MAG: hypothetical protein Q8P95_03260, partial [bacterium]|nr:hypothetical protein [bacterium]